MKTIPMTILLCGLLWCCAGCHTLERHKEFRQPGVKNVTPYVQHKKHADFDAFHFTRILNGRPYGIAVGATDVWFGFEHGLGRYAIPDSQWLLYDRHAGLEGERVQEVALYKNKVVADVWRQDEQDDGGSAGVFLFEPATLQWKPLMGGVSGSLKLFGNTLAASPWRSPRGVELRDMRTGHTQQLTTKNSALLDDDVMGAAMQEDILWVASRGQYQAGMEDSNGGGVTAIDLDTKEGKSFTLADGLARSYCSDIAFDGQRIWVAHWNERYGLSVYDIQTGKWSILKESRNGLADIGGRYLAMNGNQLLIGQMSGLILLDTATLEARKYTEQDGLPGRFISGIATHDGTAWIAAYSYDASGRNIVSSGIAAFRNASYAAPPVVASKPTAEQPKAATEAPKATKEPLKAKQQPAPKPPKAKSLPVDEQLPMRW